MTPDYYRTNPHARANALRLQQRVAGNAPVRLQGSDRGLVALALSLLLGELAPVDMVLYCPKCNTQHIDAPELDPPGAAIRAKGAWDNPPHRTHKCVACAHLWRPSDTSTNGVQATASGKDADCVPWVPMPPNTGRLPFPFEVDKRPRGPLSDAQRAHALAVGRNMTLGAAVAFASATAYVNGFQDHADITPTAHFVPVPFPHGLHPGHEGDG